MSKALQNEPKTDIRQIGLFPMIPPPEFDIQNLPQNLIWFCIRVKKYLLHGYIIYILV